MIKPVYCLNSTTRHLHCFSCITIQSLSHDDLDFYLQNRFSVNNRFNNLSKPQHSNLHRLKAADELIYEQSAQANGKPNTR